MPREIRKRGKKHKKSQPHENQAQQRTDHSADLKSGEPSWIVPACSAGEENPEAPFGYVDPDVKAYFRSVDEQIQSWQEDRTQQADEDNDVDPNEAKRVFFVAALGEMSGKEKQLATDPDCSVILERMAYSMDDFVLRVFIDRLSGSYEVLFKHRFASHVCQTLFSVSADTISREIKNVFPDVPDAKNDGELRTLTQLVLDICDEINPSLSSLIMDPFASHVLRSLLLLLCPAILPEDVAQKHVRSKKSMSWKAKQGYMKSVFSGEKGKATLSSTCSVPSSFSDISNQLLRSLRDGLDANEVRALAANKVASPVLQLFLEIEVDLGSAPFPDSLMDRISVGMIKAYYEGSTAPNEPSDYLVTLLRDPTASHLLETLISRCPEQVFNALWSTYFQGKLVRLALHPVANFVVAKATERIGNTQLGNTLEELTLSWSKLLKSSRTGVLRALIDRSRLLGVHQKGVCEAALAAVEISNPSDSNDLVPCLLLLKPLEEYRAIPTSEPSPDENRNHRGRKTRTDGQREPTVQGALILQSLMKLDEPHCSVVIDSISSLSMQDLMQIAHNATSSRVLDVLFESPSVSFKAKRRFVMSLIGHYHTLVDDRIGSRIGDRCWAFADPYLREKIARSLIPLEQFLAASFYGRFFARNLNLHLLQRRSQEWKTLQSNSKASPLKTDQSGPHSPGKPQLDPPGLAVSTLPAKSPERDTAADDDEIDAVFKAALGNKTKRAAIRSISESIHKGQPTTDEKMSELYGAIREAPGGGSRNKKKRKVG